MRQLVASVRGPQQAQQAWELACQLAARPLPPRAAERVAHCAVKLVEVRGGGKGALFAAGGPRDPPAPPPAACRPPPGRPSPMSASPPRSNPVPHPPPAPPPPPQLSLNKGDYTLLHALLSGRQRFAFGKRGAEALLRAACAADVELGELNAVLRALPPGQLSNRAFFFLIKSFEARGQVAEALHCHHQMQVLGLAPTPALEATLRRLKEGRAAAARASLAAHR
jgi:hypothetical protein